MAAAARDVGVVSATEERSCDTTRGGAAVHCGMMQGVVYNRILCSIVVVLRGGSPLLARALLPLLCLFLLLFFSFALFSFLRFHV